MACHVEELSLVEVIALLSFVVSNQQANVSRTTCIFVYAYQSTADLRLIAHKMQSCFYIQPTAAACADLRLKP